MKCIGMIVEGMYVKFGMSWIYFGMNVGDCVVFFIIICV